MMWVVFSWWWIFWRGKNTVLLLHHSTFPHFSKFLPISPVLIRSSILPRWVLAKDQTFSVSSQSCAIAVSRYSHSFSSTTSQSARLLSSFSTSRNSNATNVYLSCCWYFLKYYAKNLVCADITIDSSSLIYCESVPKSNVSTSCPFMRPCVTLISPGHVLLSRNVFASCDKLSFCITSAGVLVQWR